MAFVSLAIVEPHLAEALHLAASELALVLDPIRAETHDSASALVVIVLPPAFVDQIAIGIVELALAFHLSLHPVSQVIAAIVVDVSSLAVTQVLLLLALVSVAVCINLADFHFRPIF